jgi:anti-anti-sigma factor
VAETLINTLHGTDGAVVVEVRGELDVASAHRLREVLRDIAARLRPTAITVDLLHVTFIDSTGIGALASGSNAARTHGIPFSARHPSPFVATQLRTTGLYDTLVNAAFAGPAQVPARDRRPLTPPE